MSFLGSLLHRDAGLERPECGVMDGFVAGLPDDLPCRDAATRRVVFRCPTCGLRTRTVCDFHEAVIAKALGACEVCELAGDLVPVTFLQSGPVLGPQPVGEGGA